jgi:hypothetical protein
MYNSRTLINKRIKLRHNEDKAYIQPKYTVPKEGHIKNKHSPEGGIVFYKPSETEYFNPKKKPRDNLETYKAGLVVDKVYGIKRLKDPKRWCVLPESETVTIEVPLTKFEYNEYEKEVVQELGHVAWYKACFHVDKWVYEESQEDISVRQVLQKVEKRLPRWRTPTRYWDVEYN